jgi:hypothetical protein
MRERYFVATISKKNPEFEGVMWLTSAEEAINQVRRDREQFPEEAKDIIAGHLLNIPKIQLKNKEEVEK